MTRIVYLNGSFVAECDAHVSVFDRGLLFGDGVYEVAAVLDGKLLEFDRHIARLNQSLHQLNLPNTLTNAEILHAFRILIRRNSVQEGLVYMQVTRGASGERDFVYSAGDSTPTIFMFTAHKNACDKAVREGVSLKSVADIRWARRDIKSVNLLGQVLCKQIARDAGAYEALMIDAEGYVTECGASSFYIFKNNTVITRPLSHAILPGVTRRSLIQLCAGAEPCIRLEERLFTLQEVFNAEEAFITGASIYVLPVTRIDDRNIADGKPGATTLALRSLYLQHARESAI